MNPLVSIITPSYNQGEFIEETIKSVLNQDYPNIEYIVIDGGSTDNTLSILEKYKGRLHYISEKDEGQSDAINKGFKLAKGDIVAWLNSDDVYAENCISKAVQTFNNDSDIALVYGDGNIIDDNSKVLKKFEYTQKFSLYSLLFIWDYIMQPASFFRADALKNVGYLNKNLHYIMDWELWIKLALDYKVAYIPEILACSREYAQTKTSTGAQKRLDEILRLMQKYSKEEKPFGFDIYDCAEKLAYGNLTKEEHAKTEKQIINLLTFMPIPNRDDRTLSSANFAFNKHVKQIELVIDLEQADNVGFEVYKNGKLVLNDNLKDVGCYKFLIALESTEDFNVVAVKFNSKKISALASTYESYLKCYAVEQYTIENDDAELQKQYMKKSYENSPKKKSFLRKVYAKIKKIFGSLDYFIKEFK